MAVKTPIAKTVSLLPNWDGGWDWRYPAGNKPANPALIISYDTPSGPSAGLCTNNGDENGLGCYLTILGTNLGNLSDWGTLSHLYIGGVEVANYRCLVPAYGKLYTVLGVQALTVQVGSLGNPTPGVPLNITLSIRGAAPMNPTSLGAMLNLSGFAFTFTPNPGPVIFVSKTGNDANPGTFALPKRHMQTSNGSSAGGAFWSTVLSPGDNSTNKAPPGQHTYVMDGDWGDETGFNGRWVDFYHMTGTAPNGSANSGWIVISRYPGPVGGNAPADVRWVGVNGTSGAFNFADSASSGAQPPWAGAPVGYCKFINISNMRLVSHPQSGSDSAPINHQTAADHCWVVNCELEWRCAVGSPTAAGVAGEGTSRRLHLNYVHDIYDPSGLLQNHGFYIGNNSNANGNAANDYHGDYAFNWIEDCLGGQGIMARGMHTAVPSADPDSAPYINIHHNWILGCGKYGIELFDNRQFGRVHNNVVVGKTTGLAGLEYESDGATGANSVYYGFNTVLGWTTYAGIYCRSGGSAAGSVRFQGNLIMQLVSANSSPDSDLFNNFVSDSGIVLDNNAWCDETGRELVKPAGDAAGVYVNPQLANIATGDYTPGATSTLPNSGPVPAVTLPAFDAMFRSRPQGSNTNWARGALERVGG